MMGTQDKLLEMDGTRVVRIYVTFRRGGHTKVAVAPNGKAISSAAKPNEVIIRHILQAHRYRRIMLEGSFASVHELAKQENCSDRYIHKVLPLAYLAPDVTEAILHGEQAPGLELRYFTGRKLPLDWESQRKLLPA